MSVKKRHTTVTRLLHVWMNLDLIHASASLGTLEMDITVAIERRDPALKSGITSAQSAGSMSLIQMVREVWHLLLCTVTWTTRRVLAWQSSVTTVRAGQMWEDMKIKAVTNVTFITKERVCLSWPVSPLSLHTVNSSSSTIATTQVSGLTIHTDGGCRVILLRWHIGVERLLEVVSAHAGWKTHAHQNNAVTVMRMTKYGVKTAVSWLTRQSFQWNNSGSVILVIRHIRRTVTTLWENSSATAQHRVVLTTIQRQTC